MDEHNKKKLVDRLKQFREKNNLIQKDMYEAMQCSQAAYSSYESVKSDKAPSLEMLLNLREKYNISIDWLLENENTRKANEDKKLKTIGDIIECLFLIEDATHTKIKYVEEERMAQGFEGYPREYDFMMYGLFFDTHPFYDEYLNDFMKEWGEIREFCKGKDIGTTVYDLWKKDTVQKNKDKKTNYSFQDIPDGVEDEGLPFI